MTKSMERSEMNFSLGSLLAALPGQTPIARAGRARPARPARHPPPATCPSCTRFCETLDHFRLSL